MNEQADQSQTAELTQEEKMAQFKEFFTVEQDISVNVVPLAPDAVLPSYEHFIRDMPYSFRLASEVSAIEATSLRALRNLGHYGDELVSFLKAQSRKIDLIMSYMLTMEDDDQHRMVAHAYGGGGISIITDEAVDIGRLFKLKVFLADEASAIFCLGEVVDCQPHGESYLTHMYYARIRDEDREVLVRASLHQQSRQLKRLAETKRNEPK